MNLKTKKTKDRLKELKERRGPKHWVRYSPGRKWVNPRDQLKLS